MQSNVDIHSKLVAKGDGAMDWGKLAPLLLHPTKVLVIEAMQWIGRPMAANQLEEVFDSAFSLSAISYHMKTLADLGILVLSRERPVRGAREKFYFFNSAVIGDVSA